MGVVELVVGDVVVGCLLGESDGALVDNFVGDSVTLFVMDGLLLGESDVVVAMEEGELEDDGSGSVALGVGSSAAVVEFSAVPTWSSVSSSFSLSSCTSVALLDVVLAGNITSVSLIIGSGTSVSLIIGNGTSSTSSVLAIRCAALT